LIPSVLAQALYITLLVLFGSRARGDADSGSDWDFAFLCDEEQRKSYETGGWDSFRVWGILQDIFNLLDDQIDVIEMKDCSELLAHYIALDGKVLS
jgi:predicted nucleotidyltransferase